MQSKSTVEWCSEHKRHEPIPACQPDVENIDTVDLEKEQRAQEENNLPGS